MRNFFVRNILFGKLKDPLNPRVFHQVSLIAFLTWLGLGFDVKPLPGRNLQTLVGTKTNRKIFTARALREWARLTFTAITLIERVS
jgi:hypothetical protein